MRKLGIILLLIFAGLSTAHAQKRKPAEPEMTADSAIAIYDFGKAETLLNAEILKLRKRKESTLKAEEQLQYVHKAMQKMSAVEKVVVFDSLVLERDKVLGALCLSGESGKMMPTSERLPSQGGNDGILCQSQLGDKIYYGANNADSVLQLYSSDIYGREYTPAKALAGLDDSPADPHNYPYMMADGSTLYFAAQGSESLGGYDIFMTRYDTDEQRFLTPENVGMPFNSAANDYLLCIDEYYNIGCFVTDRNMPVDSVCVYYFIPNATRRVYLEEEVGVDTLRQLAKLSDIRLTWGNEIEVKAALARLKECRKEQAKQQKPEFTFRVADNRLCHYLSDFTNPLAQQQATKWVTDCNELNRLNNQLNELRHTYSIGTQAVRAQLSPQILEAERKVELLTETINKEEKEIRKTELGL